MFGGQQDGTDSSVNNAMSGTLPPDNAMGAANVPAMPDPVAQPLSNDSLQTPDYSGSAPAADASVMPSDPVSLPVSNDAAAVAAPADAPAPASPAPTAPVADVDALIDIKQHALQQLSPLVGHLDQQPEEKFRTTMMMIQASDDSSLINDAYQAAQQISDDKAKAQALLDIVNEINYFTQQHDNQQ